MKHLKSSHLTATAFLTKILKGLIILSSPAKQSVDLFDLWAVNPICMIHDFVRFEFDSSRILEYSTTNSEMFQGISRHLKINMKSVTERYLIS